jgi:hypothetical protein
MMTFLLSVLGIVFLVCSISTLAWMLLSASAIFLKLIGILVALSVIVFVVYIVKAIISFIFG